MANTLNQLSLCFAILFSLSYIKCYSIPDLQIEVLRPRGISASIPGHKDIKSFEFHANRNRTIDIGEDGDIEGQGTHVPKQGVGRWTFTDKEINLQSNEKLYYYVIVVTNDELKTKYTKTGIFWNYVPEVNDSKVATTKSIQSSSSSSSPSPNTTRPVRNASNGTSCKPPKCYKVPDVTILPLKPKGFKAYIPGDDQARFVSFHGSVGQSLKVGDEGDIHGEMTKTIGDGGKVQWAFTDHSTKLEENEYMYYYVEVWTKFTNASFTATGVFWNIASDEKDDPHYMFLAVPTEAKSTTNRYPESEKTHTQCPPTLTQVLGRNPQEVCAGSILFEEHFDSPLDTNKWRVEHKIPLDNPDQPFVSYQRSAVSTQNGTLQIQPTLLRNQPGFDEHFIGTPLILDQCTSYKEDMCMFVPSGSNIPPPVVSGRITSAFAFRYGTVHIRAKLPQGDWLYPDLLLLPATSLFPDLYSRIMLVMRIAMARGNSRLYDELYGNLGNSFLTGGVMLLDHNDVINEVRGKATRDGGTWGDQYHEYSLRWSSERVTLSVDDEVWGVIDVSSLETAERRSEKIFADYLSIALGVSAGGIRVFPNELVSGSTRKPWRNQAAKAKVNFWRAEKDWFPSWRGNSDLLVDYVKVTALS